MRSFKKMIMDFIGVLEKTKIDYAIIGGVAVSTWGTPRTTSDLDIIIVLQSKDMDELHKNLKEAGFSIDIQDIRNAIEEKIYFTIFDEYSEYHIDSKGVYNKFDALTIKNKLKIAYEGIALCIASPEDAIAHKLLFGGHQDIKDVETILLRQHKVDMDYLTELCGSMGILNELETIKKRLPVRY